VTAALRKAFVVVLIICAAAPTLSLIVLNHYYYTKAPREARPESGHVYVQRTKGGEGVADVYLTSAEKWPSITKGGSGARAWHSH
jgi:hypothetical protein